jgi:tetratricopeptide (TPR) repeat protein
MTQARDFFERARVLDPGNLDALIGTGQVDATLGSAYLTDDRVTSLAAAEATLTKALRLAPNNAIAHEFMGLVYLQTKRAAHGIAELERSLALNPNLAEAHGFIGLAKVFDGRAEEAEQHEKEALRLSPRDHSAWLWTHFIGGAKMQLGSDDEAAIWFRRAIELNPNLPLTHFSSPPLWPISANWRRREPKRRSGLRLIPHSPCAVTFSVVRATILFS